MLYRCLVLIELQRYFKMRYKLLIIYDIKENDSNEYNNIIIEIKKQLDWIHLQLSSWIVEATNNQKEFYNKLLSLLDENTKSKIAVFDITKQQVSANKYTGEKKNINSKRLFSSDV